MGTMAGLEPVRPSAHLRGQPMQTPPPGSPGPSGFPPSGRPLGFIEQWFSQEREAHDVAVQVANSRLQGHPPQLGRGERNELLYNPPPAPPELMLQAAVTRGDAVIEGRIVEAVAIPWLVMLEHFKHHPEAMHQID